METTKSNHLSCAVFGHNLEPLSQATNAPNVFICSSCKIKMVMSLSGDFEELPYKNNQIASALRRLFLLKRKSHTTKFSI